MIHLDKVLSWVLLKYIWLLPGLLPNSIEFISWSETKSKCPNSSAKWPNSVGQKMSTEFVATIPAQLFCRLQCISRLAAKSSNHLPPPPMGHHSRHFSQHQGLREEQQVAPRRRNRQHEKVCAQALIFVTGEFQILKVMHLQPHGKMNFQLQLMQGQSQQNPF